MTPREQLAGAIDRRVDQLLQKAPEITTEQRERAIRLLAGPAFAAARRQLPEPRRLDRAAA